jgi:hypothetical protein
MEDHSQALERGSRSKANLKPDKPIVTKTISSNLAGQESPIITLVKVLARRRARLDAGCKEV